VYIARISLLANDELHSNIPVSYSDYVHLYASVVWTGKASED